MRWVVLAIAVMLAGCSGGGDDAATTTGTTSGTGTGTTGTGLSGTTTSGTTGPGGPGSLSASLAASVTSGEAPLAVNFTLDADGEGHTNLAWTLAGGGLDEAGTDLPATVEHTFSQGTHEVTLSVTSDQGEASDSVTLTVLAPTGASDLFFDGAEDGTAQWEITSVIYLDCLHACAEEVGEHTTSWQVSGDQAHTDANSFWSDYPDEYRTRMTSTAIEVPADGSYVFSYWIIGASESNGGVDGLSVYVGVGGEFEEVQFHDNIIAEWTQVVVSLDPYKGQEIQLRFRFTSDASCSGTVYPESDLCGEGAGDGFYLDDIRVAPA